MRNGTTGEVAARRARRPAVEGLEARIALSGAVAHKAAGVDADADALEIARARPIRPQAAPGTIQGRVIRSTDGRPVAHLKVQLIDAAGAVVRTATTNASGNYKFKVRRHGAYVVHLVTPARLVQTSPTFADAPPTGSYAINPATGKPYGGSNWNYHTGNNNPANGPVGPPAWSTIAPAGGLPFQSPIDINGPAIDLGQYLSIRYNDATPRAIVNNGAQIQVQFPGTAAASITLAGRTYNLAQFHYHDTAETQVNGYTYPMEEHFVNVSASGGETVVAVFLQLGAHNAAIQPILDAATAHLTTPGTSTTLATPVDFAGLLPTSLSGWFYEGSLTTPPLSQVVNWLVLATPITLDFGQLQQYEAVAGGSGFLLNNRPVQPLDGRQVNRFDIDLDYRGDSIRGLTSTVAPRTATPAKTAAVARADQATAKAAPKATAARSLAVAAAGTTTAANSAADTDGLQPVAGCTCPLCRALRYAVWREVGPAGPTGSAMTAIATTPIHIPASAYLPDA